tara:strand:+ start:221 stop:1258 length:1038 start_codon:yes stop_codon:yes gene_type:complete
MIRDAISTLTEGCSLTQTGATEVMGEIMSGDATEAQIGAFLTALRMKGETPEEIAGMATTMRKKALSVETGVDLVDTCGTGGDGSNSFNVSTAAAVVVASANIYVAKHGNRAASGTCGSADLLEALGVKIDLAPEGVKKCIETAGIGFMFAPIFHPAMKHVAKPRKEMGIRTVFNILGPLTNPAGAKKQMIGIADRTQGELLARVLVLLGSEHAMIVHGEDGLDEITISGKTSVWEIKNKEIHAYEVNTQELGVKTNSLDEIKGESISDNVTMFRSVMDGKQGPCMDIVTLNAGAALYVAGATGSIKDGQAIAENCIKNGTARAKISQLVEISQRIGIEDKEQDY